jgi:hypothetical protein
MKVMKKQGKQTKLSYDKPELEAYIMDSMQILAGSPGTGGGGHEDGGGQGPFPKPNGAKESLWDEEEDNN